MNRKEIDKLPTPLTDALRETYRAGPLQDGAVKMTRLCEFLERKLAAVVMAMETVIEGGDTVEEDDGRLKYASETLSALKEDSHEQG